MRNKIQELTSKRKEFSNGLKNKKHFLKRLNIELPCDQDHEAYSSKELESGVSSRYLTNAHSSLIPR